MPKPYVQTMEGPMREVCEDIGRMTGSPYWDSGNRRFFRARLSDAFSVKVRANGKHDFDLGCIVVRGSKQYGEHGARVWDVSVHLPNGIMHRVLSGVSGKETLRLYRKIYAWCESYDNAPTAADMTDALLCVFPPR